MLHFYDRAGFARALTLDLDPTLRRLLAARIEALTDDLIDYTEYLVVQSGDTEQDIVRVIGLSPLVEPIDGARFPAATFHPHWDYLTDNGGWYEMIVTFGGAFAYVLFVQESDSDTAALCRRYTGKS